jgi:hypothetical protein
MARRRKFGTVIEPQDNPTHWIATVSFPQGQIRLGATVDGLRWDTDSQNVNIQAKASWANNRSNPPRYHYSPADGPVGFGIAQVVARELGGNLELAQLPPPVDEVVPLTGDPTGPAVENMAPEDLYAALDRQRQAAEDGDEQEDSGFSAARDMEDRDLEQRRDDEDADWERRQEELEEMLRHAEEGNNDPLATNEQVDDLQRQVFELGEEYERRNHERRQEDEDRVARRQLEDEATLLLRNERDAELDRREEAFRSRR